ncbi:MAG: hypothetical protein K8S87_10010, partial [Planctomycetes bacterium]|nr:hypothetical protein [Planctomycetota bacterium]
ETPVALKRDEEFNKESIFKQIGINEKNSTKPKSKSFKRSRTSDTIKKYTTEDFTAWFKPEQSRIIRERKNDVLLIQCPDNALSETVSNEINDICISYRLTFNSILPLETSITWSQALDIINNSNLVIIDFTSPKISENTVLLLTIASIARMQKVEAQLMLLNSTEEMPVLWRELPVIYYDTEDKSIERLKSKLDRKLHALLKSKD